MIQSNFFGAVAVTLEQCLTTKYPSEDWHCMQVHSSTPSLVYACGNPLLLARIWQQSFINDGTVQVVLARADAELWLTGSEREGCKVYSLQKSNEPVVSNETCETFQDLADVIMRFLNLTAEDTATNKRKCVENSDLDDTATPPAVPNKRKCMEP